MLCRPFCPQCSRKNEREREKERAGKERLTPHPCSRGQAIPNTAPHTALCTMQHFLGEIVFQIWLRFPTQPQPPDPAGGPPPADGPPPPSPGGPPPPSPGGPRPIMPSGFGVSPANRRPPLGTPVFTGLAPMTPGPSPFQQQSSGSLMQQQQLFTAMPPPLQQQPRPPPAADPRLQPFTPCSSHPGTLPKSCGMALPPEPKAQPVEHVSNAAAMGSSSPLSPLEEESPQEEVYLQQEFQSAEQEEEEAEPEQSEEEHVETEADVDEDDPPPEDQETAAAEEMEETSKRQRHR